MRFSVVILVILSISTLLLAGCTVHPGGPLPASPPTTSPVPTAITTPATPSQPVTGPPLVTPALQAAHTPVLDSLANEGACGIMDIISPGIRPGSDTAHLSLLGYPPEKYYTGRGPLEAEGTGIHMEPGMIGFRCNYATIDKNGRVTDRRAGRIHSTDALSQAIQENVDLSGLGVTFTFSSGAGHRAALAFRGEGLGCGVSSNDPKIDGVPPLTFRSLRNTAGDEKTACALNEFVRQSTEILMEHPMNLQRIQSGLPPANVVLIRGAGEMGHFEPFEQK